MVSIFLSYCQKDSCYANEIDLYFKDTNINIKRDIREISSWKSIRGYMKTIRNMEYAILIITENYLKSFNCMYEVMELMKEKDYKNKIFPVLYTTDIYKPTGKITYIKFWENEYYFLKSQIRQLKMENAISVINNLKEIQSIQSSIDEFLTLVADMNNPDVKDANKEIEKSLRLQNIMIERNEKELKSGIIAIANPAGGVGKSTVAGGLAYALRKALDKKVLCISLGSLDNAQYFLGLHEDGEDNVSVYGQIYVHKTPCGVDFIYKKEMEQFRLAQELQYGKSNWERILGELINQKIYDYIIIDCGRGTDGLNQKEILNFVKNIIIPLGDNVWSPNGIKDVANIFKSEKGRKNIWLLNSIGLFVGKSKIQDDLQQLYIKTKNMIQKENIRVNELSTIIPKSNKMTEVTWEKGILIESPQIKQVKQAYIDLAKEVEENNRAD
jgi:cellulose biosynthesis protein BcsQ